MKVFAGQVPVHDARGSGFEEPELRRAATEPFRNGDLNGLLEFLKSVF